VEELLKEDGAAKWLKVSREYLKKRRAKGLPPKFVRLSVKAIRYRIADLDAFVAARTVEPRGISELAREGTDGTVSR
jgi:hypothetical protein